MPFPHEQLRVCDRAIESLTEVNTLTTQVASGWSELVDQLKRATTSIILNIAEGAAEFRPGEKSRFYRMAIRSAAEAHAAITALGVVHALEAERSLKARDLLAQTAAMLMVMCKGAQDRR